MSIHVEILEPIARTPRMAGDYPLPDVSTDRGLHAFLCNDLRAMSDEDLLAELERVEGALVGRSGNLTDAIWREPASNVDAWLWTRYQKLVRLSVWRQLRAARGAS